MMRNNNKKELEIYIHIPFCVRKCNYCDFLSFPEKDAVKDVYMEAINREIKMKSKQYKDYQVISVFIGGGTPTAVKPEWIYRTMETLKGCFELSLEAEITMEMNPGTLQKEALELYGRAGINRLSIGLQSAEDTQLKRLGRIHTYEQFLDTYKKVREAGFENVNVDLMSGLPGQSIESWKLTLEKVLALNPPPEHISAYSLIVEEETPFFDAFQAGELELPQEEEERQMYHITKEVLKGHGYERYEISNYGKKGKECNHNLGYWQRKNYVGFGIGAASMVENVRFSNGTDLKAYLKNPCDCVENRQVLSKAEQIEETMFLGLRMTEGVSCSKFQAQFKTSVWEIYGRVLDKYKKNGLMEMYERDGEGFVRLTEAGMDVSNYVMADFMDPYGE